jgi:lactate dehydrogenase-like 2-hydroxyacid dehydrogenase
MMLPSPMEQGRSCAMAYKILICDLIGLKFGADGLPDPSEVMAHIVAKGGVFHLGDQAGLKLPDGKLNFFYMPELSTAAEILPLTGKGQYAGLIAAATFIPQGSVFAHGGVRIGAGTGNMGSLSWGGPNGLGGAAPLMNTPGFNSVATAQMAFKALLRLRPDLPVDELHQLSLAGQFDTGKDLQRHPTAKLEGQSIAILGFGNIGSQMAKLAAAFGMKVKVFAREGHRAAIEAAGYTYAASPEDAARGADVLSVHVGLGGGANVGLVNSAILDALNKDAVLINYDRGECVDAEALDMALEQRRVGQVAVDADIFKQPDGSVTGPLVPYLPLAKKYWGRVHLLPHAAADTDHPSRVAGAKQAVDQIFECVLRKRVTNLKGDLPAGYVNAGVKLGV